MRLLLLILYFISSNAHALEQSINIDHSSTLLALGFILIIAILSMVIQKIGQPTVLGQILAGCILSIPIHYQVSFFTTLNSNPTLLFLAQLGSIFLLFDIGLESNFSELLNTGKHAITVSIIGVIVPFITGYFLISQAILHSTSSSLSLLIGGVLAVTSTGISITIFKDLNMVKTKECQMVLAASIIDDILGLILLSFIISLNLSGAFEIKSIIYTLVNTGLFFAFSLLIYAIVINKFIDKFLTKISLHYDMLPLTLVSICFFFSWLSSSIGLTYTIGAFIAGLILDAKHFNRYHKISPEYPKIDIKIAISSLGKILTPIFFIYAGMQVDIIDSLNWYSIKLGLIISVFAIFSKSVCGMLLPKTINKWIVGFSMIPRGEIGIIFAVTALEAKIITHELYTALLLMIIITSLCTPIIINKLIKTIQN